MQRQTLPILDQMYAMNQALITDGVLVGYNSGLAGRTGRINDKKTLTGNL